MSEHIIIEAGRGENGWVFPVSVWTNGAYLVLEFEASYETAILTAQEISEAWDGIPVVDGVAS